MELIFEELASYTTPDLSGIIMNYLTNDVLNLEFMYKASSRDISQKLIITQEGNILKIKIGKDNYIPPVHILEDIYLMKEKETQLYYLVNHLFNKFVDTLNFKIFERCLFIKINDKLIKEPTNFKYKNFLSIIKK